MMLLKPMRSTRVLLVAAALAPAGAAIAQPPAAPKPTRAELLSADLFGAITTTDRAGTAAALKGGADPNGRNWLGFTPLAWAAQVGDIETAQLLLARGAHVNDDSTYGSPLTFAALGGHDRMGVLLLQKGAKVDPPRFDKTTPLMAAAFKGCAQMVRGLIAKRVDLNRQDNDGGTALVFAARRNQLETARLLLNAGARVQLADKMKRTPLHYAALNGSSKLVAALVAKGASANAVDATGATPLHLAARYSGNPETIKALLKAGASAAKKDGRGQVAYALAARRGYQAAADALKPATPAALRTVPAATFAGTEEAIRPALQTIQVGMKTFSKRAACVSCHHQGLGVIALAHAAQRQMPVDGQLVGSYMKQLATDGQRGAGLMHAAFVDPHAAKLIPAVDIGDFPYGAGYFLNALHLNGVPANPGLAEAAVVLGGLQKADGSWRFGFPRGTMQHSNVTTTAMVMEVLNAYWPTDRKADLDQRLAKARAWMNASKSTCAEDLAARVIGLKAAGADATEVAAATKALLAAQRPDGGWKTENETQSDAYTTGFSIYALRTAAEMPSDSSEIRKAVAYLLRTQDEDGSWYVAKSTAAYNNHFDGGFPHGYSQYASFAGTCWATIGLLETLPARSASR